MLSKDKKQSRRTVEKDKHTAELLIANRKLQKAEEKIKKANHLYAFISQVNQKIVRVKDEATLFRNACNLALEFGKFKMAWIGIFDKAQKRIAVVEHCGIPEEDIRLFTDAPYQSNGPQDYILRTGTYYICNNIENEPELENWQPFAARHDIRSCMVLPVKKSGIIIGTFNLYSTELNFAGKEEIKLLVEATGDISFALGLFEKEKQHKQEEEEINASETLYHSLFDNMQEGFAHCKMIYENGVATDFIYLDVNASFKKLTGLKNVVGEKVSTLIPGVRQDNAELFDTYNRVALTGKPERIEAYLGALKMWLSISVYSTEKGYFTAVFDVVTEKKEAEEKLANSERHYRALIEHSADMKSLTDKDGKVLYGSPSIEKGLGYTPEEFLLKYPYHLIHPDEIEGYLEKRNKLLQTPGELFTFQQRRQHKNGTWMWCEGTITNLLNEPGIHALVTNFRDISDKKLAEQQLAFSKNNLSALINNTSDLMWSVDKDFNLITANQPFDEMSKVMFGRIITPGSSVLSAAFTPEMQSHFKQLYKRAFAGESFTKIDHFDVPVETWAEISYYPIRKGNEIIGTACHSRDITASKLAERDLFQSEARLKEAQAIAHISNWEIDLLSNTHIWSDEFYKIYGIANGEVEPSTEALLSFMHPDDLHVAQKQIMESFATLTDSSANFRFIRKDGAMRYGFIEWKFELDKNKKPIRLYGILQDVTEQKVAEKEIKDLNEHLEKRVDERTTELTEANKSLEAFSYSVSHDLRSPVRSVMGFAKLIKKDHGSGLNEKAKELFGHIEESGKRMNAIIDDLLSFAKWGKEKLNLTDVDMRVLFTHVWKNIVLESAHHAVLELEDLPVVQADAAMMRQVVVNLVSNAIKYSGKKEKPVIKVGFEETPDEIIFHISDNGAGFDMEHYNRLFGAFQRLHGMSDFEGTGIGLTIIKTIIEKHKGRVWAEGKVDEGATFWFSLPKKI